MKRALVDDAALLNCRRSHRLHLRPTESPLEGRGDADDDDFFPFCPFRGMTDSMSKQLDLFAAPRDVVRPAAVSAELAAVAAKMPASIRLGTSPRSFPGWAGRVYDGAVARTR